MVHFITWGLNEVKAAGGCVRSGVVSFAGSLAFGLDVVGTP